MDAVRFCRTRCEHFNVSPPGIKYSDSSHYFVTIEPDRARPGELLDGSAQHRERSIEIWTDAALTELK